MMISLLLQPETKRLRSDPRAFSSELKNWCPSKKLNHPLFGSRTLYQQKWWMINLKFTPFMAFQGKDSWECSSRTVWFLNILTTIFVNYTTTLIKWVRSKSRCQASNFWMKLKHLKKKKVVFLFHQRERLQKLTSHWITILRTKNLG